MATDVSPASADPPAPAPAPAPPRVRAIYRNGEGQIFLDWPEGRIPEALADEGGTIWVDVDDRRATGIREVEALFRDVFKFHPLAIEDALQESNIPKLDDWQDYLYMVFHSLDFDPTTDELRLHELDIFLGVNYLVTYHYEPIKAVEQLLHDFARDRTGRLRHGPDHLLYQLLDKGVSDFLPAVEHLDDAIDEVQDEIFRDPRPRTLKAIFRIKTAALRLHRTFLPQREVLNRLARDEYRQIDDHDRVYFRDVYDQAVLIQDISETLRDQIAAALDMYLSAASHRSNEIMKVLTIFTVMFLPLNFVVGFFGMNFFGATLAFQGKHWASLPLFVTSCVFMLTAPPLVLWGYRRGWFQPKAVLSGDEGPPDLDPPGRRRKPGRHESRSRPDRGNGSTRT